MATMISNEQARTSAIERRATVDAEVDELTSGIDTSKVNLKAYRGNKYFGIVFGADGKPAYKVDPDDGSNIMIRVAADTQWHTTDALYGAWKTAGPGHKLMAWQWNSIDKEYVPSRTMYNSSNEALEPAGVLDQIVTRKMAKVSKVSMPGLAELTFLIDKVREITTAVKADKEHVKKGLAVFTKENKISLVKYSVMAFKGIGLEKAEMLRLLQEFYPELFAKESTK